MTTGAGSRVKWDRRHRVPPPQVSAPLSLSAYKADCAICGGHGTVHRDNGATKGGYVAIYGGGADSFALFFFGSRELLSALQALLEDAAPLPPGLVPQLRYPPTRTPGTERSARAILREAMCGTERGPNRTERSRWS